jgi:hypothetical protein
MIEECAAFQVSDAIPECHLGLHGFLDFDSNAFHVPVTRRVPHQRCVPDVPL